MPASMFCCTARLPMSPAPNTLVGEDRTASHRPEDARELYAISRATPIPVTNTVSRLTRFSRRSTEGMVQTEQYWDLGCL